MAWASLSAGPAAASTLVYAGFFATHAFLPAFLGAAVAAIPFAAAAGARRWRADATIAIGVAAGLCYLCYAVFWADLDYGLPGLRTVTIAVAAVAHGWGRMLSVALPADTSAGLLALPVAVTWSASYAAVTIALRGHWRLARLAPGGAAFTVAALCAASAPDAQLPGSAVFLAACAAVLASPTAARGPWPRPAGRQDPGASGAEGAAASKGVASSHRTSTHRSAARSIAATGCAIAVILAAAAAGTAALPAGSEHRLDPRDLDPPTVQVQQAVTPLATIRSQLEERPAQLVATVVLAGPGATLVDRVRMAALEDYDGSVWTTSDRFLVAGQVLADAPTLRGARTVTARISLAPGIGPYLPEVGWPTGIYWSRASPQQETGFDRGSGILVARGLPAAGGTYVLSAEATPRLGLAHAVPAADPADTALPAHVPAVLRQLARSVTAGRSTPYAKLAALDSYLRSKPYNLIAPPGHSYGALIRMLTGTAPGDSYGYSEQHAAAFALLARILGIPARVATGYLLHRGTGVHRITTRDADAWPEVPFAGYGWVPFDPTDMANTRPIPRLPAVPPQVTAEQAPVPQPSPSSAPGPVPGPHALPGDGLTAVLDDGLYGLAALAVLGVLGCAAVVAEKVRRDLRRRWAATPASRLLGAWQSARDRLIERGLDFSPAMSAGDVAAVVLSQLGPPGGPVSSLVSLVDATVFTPAEPTPDDADEARRLYQELVRGLYPHRFSLRRITALVSPRVLLASHHLDRHARQTSRSPNPLEGRY